MAGLINRMVIVEPYQRTAVVTDVKMAYGHLEVIYDDDDSHGRVSLEAVTLVDMVRRSAVELSFRTALSRAKVSGRVRQRPGTRYVPTTALRTGRACRAHHHVPRDQIHNTSTNPPTHGPTYPTTRLPTGRSARS